MENIRLQWEVLKDSVTQLWPRQLLVYSASMHVCALTLSIRLSSNGCLRF